MMINISSILVIEAFEFRICFARLTRLSESDGGQAFRASDFEFAGQAGTQEKK
jgi:hypothetical protein